MIKVTYVPQISLPNHYIRYTTDGRLLTVLVVRGEHGDREQFDFSGLQPGDFVEDVEPEALPINPIVSARCLEDGTLELKLLLWYEGEEPRDLEEVIDG